MITRILFLLFSFSFIATAYTQSVEEKITRRRPYGLDIPANAGDLLPQLYMAKSFDSIGVVLALMRKHSDEHPVEEFYLTILLHIQQSTFSINEVSDSIHFRFLLYPGNAVVNDYYKFDDWHFGYYEIWQAQLRELVWIWAADILDSRQKLSDNEFFVCNALAGTYHYPDRALRAQKERYLELYAILQKSDKQDRVSSMGILNAVVGIWIPRGNLKILGAHPSLGFQLGGRGKYNSLTLSIQVRFLKSANLYTVYRQDSLYLRNYYRGYYIGLEYTRYVYHTTHFEAGIVAGIGSDMFGIALSTEEDEDENDYLKPHSISSINLNAGIRFNYFFNPRLSIGIVPKYNAIWYKNRGGTSLQGQPISIDFLFGR